MFGEGGEEGFGCGGLGKGESEKENNVLGVGDEVSFSFTKARV